MDCQKGEKAQRESVKKENTGHGAPKQGLTLHTQAFWLETRSMTQGTVKEAAEPLPWKVGLPGYQQSNKLSMLSIMGTHQEAHKQRSKQLVNHCWKQLCQAIVYTREKTTDDNVVEWQQNGALYNERHLPCLEEEDF